MHFIYNDPVQCRLHGSIQCGSFQDPRNSRPVSAESRTHKWLRFMAFTGHLVPCDYTKDNQTSHCKSVLAAAAELHPASSILDTSKPTTTRTMVALIVSIYCDLIILRLFPALCYYAFTTFLLPSLLGRKFSGELGGAGTEGGGIMTVCAWI